MSKVIDLKDEWTNLKCQLSQQASVLQEVMRLQQRVATHQDHNAWQVEHAKRRDELEVVMQEVDKKLLAHEVCVYFILIGALVLPVLPVLHGLPVLSVLPLLLVLPVLLVLPGLPVLKVLLGLLVLQVLPVLVLTNRPTCYLKVELCKFNSTSSNHVKLTKNPLIIM